MVCGVFEKAKRAVHGAGGMMTRNVMSAPVPVALGDRPGKAGIQMGFLWIPAYAGMTLFLLCFSGCTTWNFSRTIQPSAVLQNLPAETQQVIMVEPVRGSYARVTTWAHKDGHWQPVFWPMRAMVGRSGIAPLNEKREGDGRTPSGTYALGTAFGYAVAVDTKLSYRQATERDFWVDDVGSSQYNQWVTGTPEGYPEAKSFELMKRKDDLYKYGVVIEYNTNPIIPGNGSAIFVHIWRGFGKPTSGCVAFSPRSLRHLLKWLDASQHPVIILNPSSSSN